MALSQELVPLIVPYAQFSWSSNWYHRAAWERGFALTTGSPVSHSVCRHCAGTTWATYVAPSTRGRLYSRKMNVEKLWHEFFSDPSQWWDHRSEKSNPSYPDFKHKTTEQSLWVGNKLNPPWVRAKLAQMAPGTLQLPTFSWNVRLRKYVKARAYKKAMELLQQLPLEGINPDKFTFVPVLNACANLQDLDEGRRIHLEITKRGFECDRYVANSLVDMYAKCGSIDDAWRVFNKMPTRDVVSWNALILGYVKCGQGQEALELSQRMQQEGVDLDPITFTGVLNACASIGALEEGRRVHEKIIHRGYQSDIYVASCLVDMYAKCGSIEDAWMVFMNMSTRDVVCWNAMIQGYVRSGEGQKALNLYLEMQHEGVDSDPVTFIGVLNACGSVAALEEGRNVHAQIIRKGYGNYVVVGNSLIDMYFKCGSLEEAQKVFTMMPTRDVVSWNTMLAGYCRHGHAQEALEHFQQMRLEVEVNGTSFLTLLTACSHGGLVEEGLHYFESMTAVFNISPTLEHYACVIDILGRAGHLQEAEDLITKMPCEADAAVWASLLGACRIHGNVEMGERVAKRVKELDPGHGAGYVLLSNIYAAAGKWNRVQAVHRERLERNVKKIPGCSWIEVNKEVHSFLVNDSKHFQIANIHAELERLARQLQDAGYLTDIRFVGLDSFPQKLEAGNLPDASSALQCIDEEQQDLHLCHHSEKLAIAFGLISSDPGTPLRIVKNLPVCWNCHRAIKFIAKIVGRAIIIRGADRFHHFHDGICSCRDCW